MNKSERRILVCYVPALDNRYISEAATPAIAGLIKRHSCVEISTIPSTELVPTLLSGVYPHEHQVWQVSLESRKERTTTQRMFDAFPDIVTTTAQCIWQKFHPDFDLAAIPPQRRREFTQHRFKYTRRSASPDIMLEFNGHKTIFGLLGETAQYQFTLNFDDLKTIAKNTPAHDLKFEFLEMYALDLYQHWHLDNEAGMRDALHRTDRFVAALQEGCDRNGKTLILLSDHGQEPVRNKIPIMKLLQESGVPQAEYNFFSELACTRVWFHTERARKIIVPKLQQLQNCRLFHFSEMHQYQICFDDALYGEYYVMADAGSIFFPHDFYQPIANFYLGLFGPSQRSRIFNPIHRGNHGYLPHHPSEKGFMVIMDDEISPSREAMSLIDFAPTMLTYLGNTIPLNMIGRSIL